jgi:hypothetical protein
LYSNQLLSNIILLLSKKSISSASAIFHDRRPIPIGWVGPCCFFHRLSSKIDLLQVLFWKSKPKRTAIFQDIEKESYDQSLIQWMLHWPCSAGHVSDCFSLFQLILSHKTLLNQSKPAGFSTSRTSPLCIGAFVFSESRVALECGMFLFLLGNEILK